MEEKTGSDSRYQRQKMAFLTREIREFASRELKNCQTLKAITEQFKIKQSAKPTFQRQQFSESAYAHFVEINTFFEKIISQTTIFPILDKYSLLLSSICSQYYRIFRFSNEKWDNQYKAVEQLLKNKTIIPPFKSDMCLSCSQNIWHQHIKTEKHQIYNLRIQDPFYYYNEAVVNRKQINGEEADHKKLQQKLSELALGVQMEQSCLRQILQTLNHQQKQVANQLQHPNLAESENISLPVMPMLRSVFQYTNRANKKVTSQIGIQTVQLSEKPVQVVKIPQPNFIEIISENEKIQCKLITELADKTVQIKELQLKITQSEKIEKDLKAQHSILIEQNISLQKRNSLLESQLSMTKLKNVTTKFKLASKKKSSQKTRQEMSMVANTKSFNYHETSNQQNMAERSMDHFSGGKVRGNVAYESSKFKAQQTPNKTMFIPNLYQNQKINRQSVTPGHPGSTLSIQRGSDKLEDEGLNSVIDFPSLRQSIHSNDPYRQLQSVKFEQMKPGQKKFDEKQQTKNIRKQTNLASELAKSKRKLKQITKKIINNDAEQINSWTRSQNTSPDLQQKKFRRLGKIQDRQSLLRILYDSEVKVNTQKVVNFDIFKKGYENFVLNIVGTNDSDSERNKLAKMKHLHKKSTVSIKQYYRNDFAESKDEANKVAKLNEHSIESINRYSRLSACFRDIINNIYSDGNQIPVVASSESTGKSLLTNEQIRLITEISAYMIQLKVNSFDAYSKIKTIISIQSVAADRKKGSNIAEQNRQLKQSISTIIKSHRSCQRFEGHAYCKHISVFIQNVITLMEK